MTMTATEVVIDVALEKVYKNSVRVQAINEPEEFHRPYKNSEGDIVDEGSKWYFDKKYLEAIGNPTEFEIVLRPKQ